MLIRWGSWSQRAARVAPRANEVPPHRGSIVSHPRISNSSKSLQPQQPGDGNGDLPGRYRPARCGNSNPTGWLLIGWGSWSQRTARVSPRINVEVLPHPGRIKSQPRKRDHSLSLQLPQPWDENGDPSGQQRQARCGNPNTRWLIADWLELMESARGESCPSDQRRGPASAGPYAFCVCRRPLLNKDP